MKFYYRTKDINGGELLDWLRHNEIKHGPITRCPDTRLGYYVTIYGKDNDTCWQLCMNKYIDKEYIENFPKFSPKDVFGDDLVIFN